jgi:hypothetical protein
MNGYQPGDRVWLLPDADKREVKSKCPGIVVKVITSSGRIRVLYIDLRCSLVKTVEPVRVEPRDIPCPDLRRHEKIA